MSDDNIVMLTPADQKIAMRLMEVARVEGICEGLAMYAWWEDGVQYVGTRRVTLADAIESVRAIAKDVEEQP